ncbi:Hypothetical protein PHPALM_16437 [Phytophthora palmivora]|uniref:Uncharacterized protein n=1 Tax=Phytophthora palmivora TaxID=4796 RepID=A0A2P4XPQ2_9STRA|nr:Hypothetical protein PHPALM_16437 [Phytophthora palmivora]
MCSLKDARLKTSLQGQRFRRISDLEYALQQDEDVWRTGDQDMTTSKARDFRADNIPRGPFKPKRMNRTYVVGDPDSEDSDDDDPENHKGSLKSDQDARDQTGDSRFQIVTSESTRDGDTVQTSSSASTAPPSASWTQTLTNEVYRVMGDMGWHVLKMAVIGISFAKNVNAQDTQKKIDGGISRVTGARKKGIQVECVERPPVKYVENYIPENPVKT